MSESKLDGLKKYKTIKEDNKEALYRIYSVISYIIVLIIIGIPVWWMTTRVYRAPLPLNEMYNVELPNRTNKPYGLPLSIEYDVLVTIVNPSPQDLKVELDGELLDINLQPFLDTISCAANFTVKTQWLYLSELGVVPKKMEDYYLLTEAQLPHIITPLEKKLWSHLSLRPCINLVLYVSNCKTPLFIYGKNNKWEENNSFLSSRWGGITILNPDKAACESSVYKPKLNTIISVFKKQLRHLLHIKGKTNVDLQKFKISRTRDMIDSTRRTLKSLAQLLSEISSIVISDDVANKINIAVENGKKAETYLNNNKIDEALNTSKVAFSNAETAFSDPSLLALLYFPDDQKYAVYIPLFLPVMIPVFMSMMSLRRWFKQSKQVKSKVE